jgi:hypothetical protein
VKRESRLSVFLAFWFSLFHDDASLLHEMRSGLKTGLQLQGPNNNRFRGRWTLILTDPTSNASRRYNLDTLLGIQPDCLFADRAGINTVTAIDAIGAKARFVIDHRQTDLNLIDGSFLQRAAWTYLHTCE